MRLYQICVAPNSFLRNISLMSAFVKVLSVGLEFRIREKTPHCRSGGSPEELMHAASVQELSRETHLRTSMDACKPYLVLLLMHYTRIHISESRRLNTQEKRLRERSRALARLAIVSRPK